MPPEPVTLRAAAGLVALEALGLAVAAAFLVVEVVVVTESSTVAALVTAGLAAAAAAGLALVARGLLARRRWARAPALVTNLLLVPVAIGLLQGGLWYVGGPLLALAAAVVVLLFVRPTDEALLG